MAKYQNGEVLGTHEVGKECQNGEVLRTHEVGKECQNGEVLRTHEVGKECQNGEVLGGLQEGLLFIAVFHCIIHIQLNVLKRVDQLILSLVVTSST